MLEGGVLDFPADRDQIGRFGNKDPDLIQGRDFAVFPAVIVPAQTKQSV